MARCLHPLHLVNYDVFGKPKDGVIAYDYKKINGLAVAEARLPRVVPCGKCVNCLRNKRSDFACRICREANKYGSMVFVTFTYRDGTVPFGCTLYQIDKETGEMFSNYDMHVLPDSELLDSLRYEFSQTKRSRKAFSKYIPFCEDERYKYLYFVTPSLSRLDFRLWLKRERVNYKRKFGVGLPDFSYCCIGEYGPNTLRPHMHACFMGLTLQQVYRITESWRTDFGYTWLEKVNVVNEDGTSGFVKASQYVAKYLFKGDFDNPHVRLGEAEKGRICCSINLGTELEQREIDYYRAVDVFGNLDFKHCLDKYGNKLSLDSIQRIADCICRRSVICVNGSYFRLPRAIVRRLFYETVKSYKNDGTVLKFQYKPLPLRRACSCLIQANFLRNYWKQFEYDSSSESQRAAYCRFRQNLRYKEICESQEIEVATKAFHKSISKSIY